MLPSRVVLVFFIDSFQHVTESSLSESQRRSKRSGWGWLRGKMSIILDSGYGVVGKWGVVCCPIVSRVDILWCVEVCHQVGLSAYHRLHICN